MRHEKVSSNSKFSFFLWCHRIMSIWSEKIMDIGLNFIDIRCLIFTKVKDACECKLIITLITCSHLHASFKGCGPILFKKFRYVWLHIYEWSREIHINFFITTNLGKRSNMFTFLLVPFALLRQKGRGLSRQGNPFSSTVFHLREWLSAEFKSLSSSSI